MRTARSLTVYHSHSACRGVCAWHACLPTTHAPPATHAPCAMQAPCHACPPHPRHARPPATDLKGRQGREPLVCPISFISMREDGQTRMHSSRMRTVRCSGRLWGGGQVIPACTGQEVCVSQHAMGRGVSAQEGGVCQSACWDTHLPSEQNHRCL